MCLLFMPFQETTITMRSENLVSPVNRTDWDSTATGLTRFYSTAKPSKEHHASPAKWIPLNRGANPVSINALNAAGQRIVQSVRDEIQTPPSVSSHSLSH